MAKFGQFLFGEELFGEGITIPTEIAVTRVPWQFIDYSLSQIYEMAINPLDVSMPSIQKKITSKPTATGQIVKYEGRPEVQSMSFSGTILTEAQYNIMVSWFNETKQILIVDDLGEKHWVYLTSFSPTRTRSVEFPWRMEYQAEAKTLDWGSIAITSTFGATSIGNIRKKEAIYLLPYVRSFVDLDDGSAYSFNVTILQRALNLIIGAELVVDGNYDIATTDAVSEYQDLASLTITGDCHSDTKASLIADLMTIQSAVG